MDIPQTFLPLESDYYGATGWWNDRPADVYHWKPEFGSALSYAWLDTRHILDPRKDFQARKAVYAAYRIITEANLRDSYAA